MAAAIDLRSMRVNYGQVTAVHDVSVTVETGEIAGLLGSNGAGKSTTMRAMCGLAPISAGQASIGGHDLTIAHDMERARARIGYCPDVGGLVRSMTPREHIAIALALHGHHNHWPAAMELAEQLDLLRVFEQPTAGFSHGMSRRLSVLLACLTATDALVLDEPFDGVDPDGILVMRHLIAAAAHNGVAVVLSTHLLPLLADCTERITVISHGRSHPSLPAADFAGPEGESRYRQLTSQLAPA